MPPPLSPQATKLLAQAAQHLRAGQPAAAAAALREAANRHPGHAVILHDLGLACLEAGDPGEAIDALQGAVAANPRYADAHLRLGIALEYAGALEAALASYRRASEVLPSLADARYRAGELLESLGRMEEAVAAFRRAAASAPKTLLGRMAIARAYLAENRDAEAEKTLRQALAVDRNNAAALDLLGHVLADSGRFDEARETLLRSIDAAPLRAGNFYDVVRCRPVTAQDTALMERIRAASGLPGLEPIQRARVNLALGKAADDLGQYQTAMRYFDMAEKLRSAVAPFDLASFEARVDQLVAAFSPDLFDRPRKAARDESRPILIVGLPRSGTTLVEQVFAAHPDVAAGGELFFWTEHGPPLVQADMPENRVCEAASGYLHLLGKVGPDAARVTDKMPLNFLWAGLIHLALPNAMIIHCRRAVADTALSIHQTHFNARMPFPTGGAALVGYIRAYQRLCAHWRRVLPQNRFLEIDYESLVAAPEQEINRLIPAAGLPWNEACLHPERNTRAVKTASKWQARQKIYRSSAGRAQAYAPFLGEMRALLPGQGAQTP
jgi:tetratricopeptide (TPR) repeat protein